MLILISLFVSCDMFTVDVGEFIDNLQQNGNTESSSTPKPPTGTLTGTGVGTMIAIPGGSYTFGQVAIDPDDLTRVDPFYLGETEVTQGQWVAVMTDWPGKDETDTSSKHSDKSKQPNSTYGKDADYPAYYISWYDAVEFCNALSRKENLSEYYTINKTVGSDTNNTSAYDSYKWLVTINGGPGYRLPTEVEWEYAAGHGGFQTDGKNQNARTTYSGTDNSADLGDYTWFWVNSGGTTHVVGTAGSAKPDEAKSGNKNALGLFDMSGNMQEWCWDLYNNVDYSRTSRGGGWSSGAIPCYQRWSSTTSYRYYYNGFRVARSY